MSANGTEDRSAALVEQLANDLQPVEPIPPVRRMLGIVLAAAVVVAGLAFAVYGLREGFVDGFMSDLTYASVLVGLVLAVGGACTAALGSVIPGRESLVRAGALTAGAGIAFAIVVAVLQTPWSTARFEQPMAQMACIARGVVFAVIPAVALMTLAARGWAGRPEWTVALGLFGTGAAGALLVHLTCPAIESLHILFTHLSTPILVTAILTLAFTPLMRRLAR